MDKCGKLYQDIFLKEMRITDSTGYHVSMQVNGVVTVTDNAYDTVTNEIVEVVERIL